VNLFTILNANNYHTFNREIARRIGLEAAIFLSEVIDKYCYFEKKDQIVKGWFYLTIDAVEERTTLSRRQQDTAIDKLIELKFIETKQMGMPAKRHFRVFKENITEWLNCTNKIDENAKQGCTQTPNKDSELVQTVPHDASIYKNPKEEHVCYPPPVGSDSTDPKVPQKLKKRCPGGGSVEVSLQEIFSLFHDSCMSWTAQEIHESWNILVSYEGEIRDPIAFFEGTIKNLRNKEKSKYLAKKGNEKCKQKENDQPSNKSKVSTLVLDTEEQHSLGSLLKTTNKYFTGSKPVKTSSCTSDLQE